MLTYVVSLAEQLLRIYPEMRDDRTMMVAYTFIINFMEAISNETKKLNAKNQQLLKDMILASKLSDLQVKKFIEANAKEVRGIHRSCKYATLTLNICP